jgi:O-antigen ligase
MLLISMLAFITAGLMVGILVWLVLFKHVEANILVIFVLLSYTLFRPLSIRFPLLGDLMAYHIALPLASAALFFIIFSPRPTIYRRLPSPVVKFYGLYLVFLAVITISAFHGIDFVKSYSVWRNYAANLLLVTLVTLTLRKEEQINVVLYALIAVTTLGAVLGGLQVFVSPKIAPAYLFLGEPWLVRYGYLPVGYANMPYKFGNDMLVGFLPTLALFLGQPAEHPNRIRILLVLSLILGGLLLSRGLSSLIGSAIGTVYIIYKFGIFKIFKKFLLIIIALMSIIGLLFSKEIIIWLINTYTSYQYIESRWCLVLAGLQMLQTAPFTGIGLANFSILSPEYLLKICGFVLDTGPHNVFLQVLVENGIIGLALYLSIWWYAFHTCSLSDTMQPQASSLKTVGVGLRGTLIGYMIDALFHNYTFDNHLWLIIGLCISVGNCALSFRGAVRWL